MPKTLKLIILLTLLGLLIRVAFLSSRPLSYDEAFSLALAKAKTEVMIKGAISSFNPPFYFLLLKLWLKVNQDLVFLRFLSTLLGTTVIFAIGLVGQKLFNSKVGITSSFLAAFSPVFIFESTNLRMYSLVLLESLLIIYFFLRFLKTKKNSFLIGLGLTLLFGLYTQYYFALTVLVLNFFFFVKRQKNQPIFNKWLILQISLFLLYLPLLWLFFRSPRPAFYPATNSLLKIPGVLVTLAVAWDAIQILKLFPFRLFIPLNIPLFLLTFGLLFASLGGLKSFKKDRPLLIFFLLYLFLPLGIVSLISFLTKPLLGLRSFILFSPPYYLLAALGMASLKKKKLVVAIGGFSIVAGLLLTGQYLGFKATWTSALPYNFVKQNSLPSDIFVHSDLLTFLSARFYLGGTNQWAVAESWYPRETEAAIGYNLLSSDKLPKKGNRLWYFFSETQYFNRGAAEEKQKEFEKNYPKVLDKEFKDQDLKIILFDLVKK